MSIKAQTKAAINLLNRNQPRRSQADLQRVLQLTEGGSQFTTVEKREQFIEDLLSTVDVSQKPLQCRRCQAFFVRSEVNRDGDEYRCPSCGCFTAPGQSGGARGSIVMDDNEGRPVPKGELRQMEAVANDLFSEYARLYYGRTAVSSVYLWESEHEEGSNEKHLGVGIFITHRKGKQLPGGNDLEGGEASLHAGVEGGVWHSGHIVTIAENTSRDGDEAIVSADYAMQSKVYLDVDIRKKEEKEPNDDDAEEDAEKPDENRSYSSRFNGFVSKRKEFQVANIRAASGVKHIGTIGTQIQQVENSLRDSIIEIYFGKAQQVLGKIRPAMLAVHVGDDEGEDGAAAAAMTSSLPPPMPGMRMLTHPAAAQVSKEDKDEGTQATEKESLPEEDLYANEAAEKADNQAEEVSADATVAVNNDVTETDLEEQRQKEVPEPVVQEEAELGDTSPGQGEKKDKKKKKKKPRWTQEEDEEGNIYYYNRKTGDTSWEPPEEYLLEQQQQMDEEQGETVAVVAEAVDERPVEEDAPVTEAEAAPQQAASEPLALPNLSDEDDEAQASHNVAESEEPNVNTTNADDNDAAPENPVEELLNTLSLQGSVAEYTVALAMSEWGAIETVDQLLDMTQWDVPEGHSVAPVEMFFPTFGDRRKVLKWAKKQLAATQQDEEEATNVE